MSVARHMAKAADGDLVSSMTNNRRNGEHDMSTFDLSRRQALLMGGAALTGVAASRVLGANSAHARAPFVQAKPPAFYHFSHGTFQISIISDGPLGLGDGRKVMKEMSMEDMTKSLENAFLPADSMVLQQNITVVNTGDKLAIIDTGMGASKMFGDTTGRLPANLKAAGIDPAAVDAVILSHCHPDHAGGLVDGAGKSVFPNAQVYVNEEDFKFWTDEAKLGGDLKAFVQFARDNLMPHKDKITFIKGGQEIITGIQAIDAPGHTVGHTIFMVTSENKPLAVTADIAHHSVLMVETPRIEFAYDTDSKLAVQTRLKTWDMLSKDRIPFIAFHFPWPGLGHLARNGEAFRYFATPIST
jgi:glyoxylase-like metal-dependent hydrolase (beta-lactamase superfamily II)